MPACRHAHACTRVDPVVRRSGGYACAAGWCCFHPSSIPCPPGRLISHHHPSLPDRTVFRRAKAGLQNPKEACISSTNDLLSFEANEALAAAVVGWWKTWRVPSHWLLLLLLVVYCDGVALNVRLIIWSFIGQPHCIAVEWWRRRPETDWLTGRHRPAVLFVRVDGWIDTPGVDDGIENLRYCWLAWSWWRLSNCPSREYTIRPVSVRVSPGCHAHLLERHVSKTAPFVWNKEEREGSRRRFTILHVIQSFCSN